ncbi:hypothetical protein ACMD2_22661, partial [Ananas comosus]
FSEIKFSLFFPSRPSKPSRNEINRIDSGTTNSCVAVMEGKALYLFSSIGIIICTSASPVPTFLLFYPQITFRMLRKAKSFLVLWLNARRQSIQPIHFLGLSD